VVGGPVSSFRKLSVSMSISPAQRVELQVVTLPKNNNLRRKKSPAAQILELESRDTRTGNSRLFQSLRTFHPSRQTKATCYIYVSLLCVPADRHVSPSPVNLAQSLMMRDC